MKTEVVNEIKAVKMSRAIKDKLDLKYSQMSKDELLSYFKRKGEQRIKRLSETEA